jgi:glucokinase
MVGRPPVVLGLDFGGTKIAVAVCDLQGNRLASATVSASPAPAGPDSAAGERPAGTSPQDARTVFDRAVRAARGLLTTAAPGSELAAVGVATFGIPYEDRVELAPAIDGWESLALGRELREAFGGAVIRMATDAKAAAAAESRWGALHGCDPAVYLNLGTGLAAAIVAGGQVISGGNGAAGEIGYNLRAISDVGAALSARTMLEERVSGQGIAQRASRQPGRAGRLTAADVFAAGPADAALGTLIAEFADELAYHLVNLAILIDPVRIAVGGGLVRSWDQIGPQLTRALAAGPPFPPELVLAHFPYDAPLLGAVALAVDAAAGPQIGAAGSMTGTPAGRLAGFPAGAGSEKPVITDSSDIPDSSGIPETSDTSECSEIPEKIQTLPSAEVPESTGVAAAMSAPCSTDATLGIIGTIDNNTGAKA